MDNIPIFEEDDISYEYRKIIDDLVEFQRTRCEPRYLAIRIEKLFSPQGYKVGAIFFRKLLGELHTSKYEAHSESVFRKGIEKRFNQLLQQHFKQRAENLLQAQEEARKRFGILGKEMAQATAREKRVEIARERAILAPSTGDYFPYENHCWHCPSDISSAIHARCPNCRWYICGSCGSCKSGCSH